MKIPKMLFKKILYKWKDAILNSTEINDFCMNKYNKKPLLFVGFNAKDPIIEDDCPAIIIYPASKTEGLLDDYTYNMVCTWSILNKNITKDTNTIEYDGLFETDELGNLIYEVLSNCSDISIKKIEYEIQSEWFPLYPAFMQIAIDIPVPMGVEDIEY